MVQIKPADIDRFLSKPDPRRRVVLIHGSDEGAVSERAEAFARAVAGDDPMARVRLEADALAGDPGRLVDEANAVPLFGGERVISLRLSGNRSIEPAIKALLAAPPVDSWVVVIAGELRKSSPLRRLCEQDQGAAAIACYADADRDLDRIIDEETAAANLAIAPDARVALKSLIGADRLVSRGEVAKLCLYAAGNDTITVDDVRSVVGDAAAFAVDETVDAMALGDAAALDRGYRRLLASGTPGFVIAGAALRHFNFLEKARAAFDDGTPVRTIVERARPPVFFQRQPAVARQIPAWSSARIARALAILDQAMLDSRLHGAIADDVIGEAFHLVTAIAATRARAQ
jgi:DNA polymerase III subunit delta